MINDRSIKQFINTKNKDYSQLCILYIIEKNNIQED